MGQFVGFICGVSMILGGVYGLAPPDMELTVPHTHQVFADMPDDSTNHNATLETKRERDYLESAKNQEVAAVMPYSDALCSPPTEGSNPHLLDEDGNVRD